MKRFFLQLIGFVLLLLLPFALFIAYVQSLPPQFANTLMGSAGFKYDLLRQPGDEPRLIIAGGSSAVYGVDCAYLSELTGRPCIDIGAVYLLGIGFYTNMLEGNLRQGDIVLFAPEYGMWEGRVGYALVWQACESNPALFAKLPLRYWPHMLAGPFFSYAQEKIGFFRAGIPTGDRPASMTDLGDVTFERVNILERGYMYDDPITVNPDIIDEDAVREINALQRHCASVGATLVVTYPPANPLALVSSDEDLHAFSQALQERVDADIVGEIEDAFFDPTLFYDTNFHLNSEGARLRSELLAELLAPYLP